jgi:hypothetical protein
MTNINILGNPSSWAVNEGVVIPKEYILPMPQNGIRLVRRNIRRQVDTTLPITPNTTDIRFKIPASNVVTLDFRRGGVHVVMGATVNPPHLVRFPNFSWNCIERFRLEQHNQYIEDLTYFNYQETFKFWTTVLIDQFRTTAVGLYGSGSPAIRNSRSASWEYIMPIPTDSICKTIMPWFQIINANGIYSSSNLPDVWMIWNIADPNEFLEVYNSPGAGTGLTYSITKMELEYDEITLESGNTGKFLKAWHSDPSPFPRIRWPTYQTFIYPLTQALTQTVIIDNKVKALQHIVVIFRRAVEVGDPTVYDKFEKWIGPTHPLFPLPLLEYQWEINNQLWPDSPVTLVDPGNTEPYKKFLELFGNYYSRFIHGEVTAIGPYQFSRDKFFIAFDANQYPFTTNMISPISTEKTSKSTILRMKFSAPPPAGLEVMVHTCYWRQWLFAASAGKIVDW